MGELGLNKIFGALLATALGVFALQTLSGIVFSGGSEGAHHGDEHAEAASMTEQMCEKFAYCVEVADAGGTGGEAEEVFDLGLLLASADIARGERTFKGKCATCHTIDQGGANGTGPNLHNVVGADKAAHAGFAYSAVLEGMDGDWNYANLNDWLYNPSSYARGTTMSFAGLRRDDDRVNVIAYLAANTTNPPAFPEPLAASAEEGAEGEEGAEAVEGDAVEATLPADGVDDMENPTPATGEVKTIDSVDATGRDDGGTGETVTVPAEAVEAVEDAAGEAEEAVTEATDDN
ncbi:c-type cytochrome [Hyphomonas sp. UBA4494]|jgi:cytochrome c|uniref:c-type cytochrome n=1 Tax=Hyphomonas sp. UBA4494 TaxID=1946631 RepID=UPI0025BD5420|nr:c-type cytochrome [Hyphomonas sp. UBA4494]